MCAIEDQEKDRLSANCRKGLQVLWNLLEDLPLEYLSVSRGRKARTSFTQQRKDGGLADFHCRRISLLAKSEANAMAYAWDVEV